jgi:hypothetical protein
VFGANILAQNSEDTLSKYKDTFSAKIFISGGINSIQYYSSSFFYNVFNQTGVKTPPTHYIVNGGSMTPAQIIYNTSITSPMLNIGIEYNSGRLWGLNLNHVLDINYMSGSGNYSYNTYYHEYSPYSLYTITTNDTIRSSYTQSIVSISYKFQPTYKFLFLSFGINFSINTVNVTEEHQEEISNYAVSPFPIYDTHNTSGHDVYISFPLELGGGVNIRVRRITLKPAVYYSPSFTNGYNIYTACLSLGYSFHHKKEN